VFLIGIHPRPFSIFALDPVIRAVMMAIAPILPALCMPLNEVSSFRMCLLRYGEPSSVYDLALWFSDCISPYGANRKGDT